MKPEKKQLLLISNNSGFVAQMKEGLSLHFEFNVVSSMHSGYNMALILLPDLIFIDQTSISSQNLKNLSNFKSTHFLNKCWLVVYAQETEKGEAEKIYKPFVDDIYYSSLSPKALGSKIIQRVYSNFSLTNYWKDSFMGLFNLLSNPVVLLQYDSIVSLNDAFKHYFKIDKTDNIKLTEFVNCENKAKVKESLRNFARGKHMKAVTRTTLRLKNDKMRDAKISFSKLDKMIPGQYIMMIHFTDKEDLATGNIGSNSAAVENCFEENSKLTHFSFTTREKEIIQLLCKGYKTKEISDALFISPKTIEKHRANIIKRTNSETILESIIYAISHNLIDLKMA